MAARILTDTASRKAKPSDHVIRLRDASVRELHLVVAPSGSKTWALSFTSPETGRRRSIKLGVYLTKQCEGRSKAETTLEVARDRARGLRAAIRRVILSGRAGSP